MDSIPHLRLAHSRKPNQHRRLRWQPRKPNELGDQRHCRYQGDVADRISHREGLSQLQLQCTSLLAMFSRDDVLLIIATVNCGVVRDPVAELCHVENWCTSYPRI